MNFHCDCTVALNAPSGIIVRKNVYAATPHFVAITLSRASVHEGVMR